MAEDNVKHVVSIHCSQDFKVQIQRPRSSERKDETQELRTIKD